MLTEQEAHSLMSKFIELRDLSKSNKEVIPEFKKHERICIESFKYLVTMKTNRYKAFHNYDDLNQEGFEALLKAMKTFNQKKGSFFSWAHNYIGTRVARCANLHTTIRYPLKVAKETIPHKETMMPLQIEQDYKPDVQFDNKEKVLAIDEAFKCLTEMQKEVLCGIYGLNYDKPLSINKICKQQKISRLNCIKTIETALEVLKENIKL